MPTRTPEEIRASIEDNRAQLALSVDRLRGEVERVTDWRGFVSRHRTQVLTGAAVAGFVLGGGLAAFGTLRRRRRSRTGARGTGSRRALATGASKRSSARLATAISATTRPSNAHHAPPITNTTANAPMQASSALGPALPGGIVAGAADVTAITGAFAQVPGRSHGSSAQIFGSPRHEVTTSRPRAAASGRRPRRAAPGPRGCR